MDMVGNLVLRLRSGGAVKLYFRTYIQRYTSPNENFEYGYPYSNALLQFPHTLECCKPHNAARHPMKCNSCHQTISYSITQDILSHIFDIIKSDAVLQKQVH